MDELTEQLGRIEALLTVVAQRPPREYLKIDEAADFIGVSRQVLDKWRMEATGPAVHRVGRRVLYSIADLRAFMDTKRVGPLA